MMLPIQLRLKQPPTVPLEAEVISPDRFVDLSHSEIRALTVYHGKRQCRLDEFFEIEGERSDALVLHGDLRRVRWLGRDMSQGSLTIHGSVGMHLGAWMRGGEIRVHGDAGDWVGAEMKQGLIRIDGNAGGQIGAAYRGSLSGMKNGTILIGGSVGLEVGMRMRRGTIVVGGPARDFTGLQMKGGTILLMQGAELRTGAWMNRGTIISLRPIPVLPTFRKSGAWNPTFLPMLARYLAPFQLQIPFQASEGTYQAYSGDMAVPGSGELLIWQAN